MNQQFFPLHILCYSNSFRYAVKVWFVSVVTGSDDKMGSEKERDM